MQGRLRDRHVEAGLRVLPGAERFQFPLRQLARILGGGDGTAHVGEPCEDIDRERGCDAVLAPLAAPEVLDPVEFLVERAQFARRPAGVALGLPACGQRAGRAEPPAGIAAQGIDIEPLGLAVGVGVAAVVAGKAPGVAEIMPVGGLVDRALEERRVHEGLRDQNRMPITGLPVVAEAAQHRGDRERGKTRKDALRAEDDEAGVVRDQMQALELLRRRPPDPAVPVPALEGAGLPPGKRDPQPAPFDDVAQAASGEALEAEVMVPLDRRIPLHAFIRLREADHDIGKREAVRRALEEGSAIRSVAHAAMTNRTGGEKPAENATTSIGSSNRQRNLAWDGPGCPGRCP